MPMSNRKIYLAVLLALAVPLSLLFYHVVYFLIAVGVTFSNVMKNLPGVLAYLGLFATYVYAYFVSEATSREKQDRRARIAGIIMTATGGLSLILLIVNACMGNVEDLLPHGVGYPMDSLILGLLLVAAGVSTILYLYDKLPDVHLDEEHALRPHAYVGNAVAAAIFGLLDLYFLGGVLLIPSYAEIVGDSAFVLLACFLAVLFVYAVYWLTFLKPAYFSSWKKRLGIVGSINVLVFVLFVVSFCLSPNALVLFYPSLIPLEIMGSLYLFPFVYGAFVLLSPIIFYVGD